LASDLKTMVVYDNFNFLDRVRAGFLPVRAWSSTVLVRTGAGGAVPASSWYQVVQYGGRHGTGSTGTETVLKTPKEGLLPEAPREAYFCSRIPNTSIYY
jgi:hypothetical protein